MGRPDPFDKVIAKMYELAVNEVMSSNRRELLTSIHGIRHWQSVEDNGIRLANETGANIKVVRLFAVFHDFQRLDHGADPEHGLRASKWLQAHLDILKPHLQPYDRGVLFDALENHSEERTSENLTIGACWDADRMDLTRAGVNLAPEVRLLSTNYAKSMFVLS